MEKNKNHTKEKDQRKASSGSKLGTVVGVILCIILIPILVANVTMIVKSMTDPDKVPTFAGYSPLIVLTDSMYPSIKSGDLIIVKSAEASEVKEGDVISFFDPDSKDSSVVTHRVVSVLADGSFKTKGDANNTEDDTAIPPENLVGIYRWRIGGAGNVAMFLQTTTGLIVCVGVPLILLIAYELIRRRRYERSSRQDTEALLAELELLRARQAEAETKKTEESTSTDP